jgi:hypothetical protein
LLPASLSLPSLPHASLSAVSLLDHGHTHGFGYDHAFDGQQEGEEESGPTPEDALRRADFGRRLIGYENLPLEWRNNPWLWKDIGASILSLCFLSNPISTCFRVIFFVVSTAHDPRPT